MPLTCKKQGGKYRIVESGGKIGTNESGNPIDGGGHKSQEACMKQARAVNRSISASFYYTCSDLDEATGSGLVFEKEIIHVGEFEHNEMGLSVGEDLISHWASIGTQMIANGIDIPVPVEHTTDPESRRGSVIAMWQAKNSHGLTALFGRIKFRDKEAAKLARTADVSLYAPPEFTDGKGKTYVRPIRHVALTDYPVIPGLDEFEAISASLVVPKKKEGTKMPFVHEAAQALGLEFSSETPGEDIATAVLSKIKSLAADGMEDEDDEKKKVDPKLVLPPEEGKNKEDEEEDGKKKTELSKVTASHGNAPAIVKMMRENRVLKLSALVDEGKITPAVKKKMIEKFCTNGIINIALSSTASVDDFDTVMEMFAANESVLSYNEYTGAQAVQLSNPNGVKDNPIVVDAERRAAAAKA